jgi:hypothetical protein
MQGSSAFGRIGPNIALSGLFRLYGEGHGTLIDDNLLENGPLGLKMAGLDNVIAETLRKSTHAVN